jgi:NAD(P)-dependent dehydrogenase (short-subunit alcohol dehydrogenase family)
MAELALVTGGETGIGAAIAAMLRGEGYEVRTASRRNGWDLTDPATPERLVAGLERLDLLVHNAGIAESAPLARTTDELWERHLALNATAPMRLTRAALPLLKRAPRPRVVFIASTAGLRGSPYIAAYAASKHALVGLARVLATELKGIAVHTICPGFVDSPLTDRSVEQIAASTGQDPAQAREALAALNAGGRLIRPEEVAEALRETLRAVDPPATELVLE